jgi:serine protease Do
VAGGVIGGLLTQPFLRGQPAAGPVTAPPAVVKELTSYRDIVKKVLPAVVSIETRARPLARAKADPDNRPSDRPRSPEDLRKFFQDQPFQSPEDLRKFFEQFQDQPFDNPEEEGPQHAFGSGFVVNPQGVILTNFHVVKGADQVEVTLKDGRKFLSRDIKGDAKTDLAVVRIDAKEPLPYLELGDSDAMEIGDRVLAVGAPFGLTGSVTHGIISAKGRHLHMNMYEDFLQTDAAINPGNSGGPLIDLEGKVIGINSVIKSRSGGFQGVGLAISSNMARDVMEQLLKNGVVRRGYLGVQIKDLEPEVAARLGAAKGGVLVSQVFPGSPAAKAGLHGGDVLTALAGKPVQDSQDLQRAVAALPLTSPVDVNVVRDGKPLTLHVTVEEQPQTFGMADESVPESPHHTRKNSVRLDKIGVEVTDATPEQLQQAGFAGKGTGVLVTKVDPDGPAADAGLRRGMLIAKADQKPVTSAAAVRDVFTRATPERGVLLEVQTPQGGISYVLLKVPAGGE